MASNSRRAPGVGVKKRVTRQKMGVSPTSRDVESKSSHRRRQPKTKRTNGRISQTQTTRKPANRGYVPGRPSTGDDLEDIFHGIRRNKKR